MLTTNDAAQMRRATDVYPFGNVGSAINASASVRPADQHYRTSIEIQPDVLETVCGVEIQITGLTAQDDFRAYPLNFQSRALVTHRERLIVLAFKSANGNPVRAFSQSARLMAPADHAGRAKYFWLLTLASESGADRIGVEINACAISVTYRWCMMSGAVVEEPCAAQVFRLDR